MQSIWRLANLINPTLTSTIGCRWHINEGEFVCQWYSGTCMPQDLIDLLVDDESDNDNSIDNDDDPIDFNIEDDDFYEMIYDEDNDSENDDEDSD